MPIKTTSKNIIKPTKLTDDTKDLYDTILSMKDGKELHKFFQDLLTAKEIKEFSNRWMVAQMLNNNDHYSVIIDQTSMSTTTVARIKKWLYSDIGGYKMAIEKKNAKEI